MGGILKERDNISAIMAKCALGLILFVTAIAAILGWTSLKRAEKMREGEALPLSSASDGMVETLGVELRTDKVSYRVGEQITIEVLLVNHSSSPLYIYRNLDWGESSSFSLWLKDSDTGRSIPQRFMADALTPPPNSKEDFIRVLPDHVFGLRLKTTVGDLGLSKRGKYVLVVDYHSPIPSSSGFGLPLWSKEKGVLHSNSVTISIDS